MSIRRLIVLLLLFVGLSSSGDDWVTVKFGELATIDMPGFPKTLNEQGQKVLRYKDSLNVYAVFASNKTRFEYGTEKDISKMYDGFQKGLIETSNSYLVSTKDIQIDTLIGREAEFDISKNNKEYKYVARMIWVNGVFYSYGHMFFKTHPELSINSDKFFNSFKLDRTHALNQSMDNDGTLYQPSYKLGYKLGFLLIPAILIATVIILVVVVRRKKIF